MRDPLAHGCLGSQWLRDEIAKADADNERRRAMKAAFDASANDEPAHFAGLRNGDLMTGLEGPYRHIWRALIGICNGALAVAVFALAGHWIFGVW